MKVTKRKYTKRARAAAMRETHQSILYAARQAFFSRNYDEVNLSDIASESGVTVQTILRHFQSKAGLVAAMALELEKGFAAHHTQVQPGDIDGVLNLLLARYEKMGDAIFRVMTQEDRVPAFKSLCDWGRRNHRQWIESVFSEALPQDKKLREIFLLQILLCCDVYAWKLMRREQKASLKQTHQALKLNLEAVLNQARQRKE